MLTDAYRVFCIVTEEGSISKAAKRLFVTQPAVSKSIKQLEREVGLSLFRRTAKGVELTPEGQLLYEHASRAFQYLEAGEKQLKQLKERTYGAVRIGISNTLCRYYFMPFLKAFHQVYPKLRIEIVNRTSTETVHLLESGRLDCAIISEMNLIQGYDYMKLLSIQDIFVAKRPAPKDKMTLKDLEEESMLLLEKKNATRAYLDTFLLDHQIRLNVDIEISSMEFLVEFAKIGLGVASVIEEFVEDEIESGLLYVWDVKPKVPKRSIGLLVKKGANHSVACNTFIDFMLDGIKD